MRMADRKLSILNTTKKGRLPSLPFSDMKDAVMGKHYELSAAFVEEKTSRSLNRKWRHKDRATNVLSFALSEESGELVLCLGVIRAEAPKIGKTVREHLKHLLIHGMLHLKGYAHGSTMEREERKFLKRFS